MLEVAIETNLLGLVMHEHKISNDSSENKKFIMFYP